jgi:hypothetical protein
LLNEKGEEVDEEGNVLEPRVGGGVRAVSTFKVNAKTSEEKRKVDKLEAFAALRRETAAEVASSADLDWVDPSVSARRRGGRAEFKVRLCVSFPRNRNRSTFLSLRDTKRTFKNTTKEGGILSKPRGRRGRGPIDAGTTGCDTDRSTRRARVWFPTEPRRAASAHCFFFSGFSRTFFTAYRKLHSVARMLVSRCNFYACHNEARALESGRPDGRDPFARATRFLFSPPAFGNASLGPPRPAADEVR